MLLGQQFAVMLVTKDHADLKGDIAMVGTCKIARQQILVADDLAPDQERDTILHEVLHGLLGMLNVIPKNKAEERVVMTLAPILLDTLRRNPALVTYLLTATPWDLPIVEVTQP